MKKHFKYLFYVLRHKWFVFIECCKLGIPWRGLIHDWSKFLPSEWFAYVEQFNGKYGYNFPKEVTDATEIMKHHQQKDHFNVAWLLHQKRNPHHWQFWMLQGDSNGLNVLQMPNQYVKEMYADWRGAGRALGFGNDVSEWYSKNRDKIILNPKTRSMIEELIDTDIIVKTLSKLK